MSRSARSAARISTFPTRPRCDSPRSEVFERRHNPFLNSATGGRILSALQLPLFLLRPPAGYGVLTTTGRRSGKRRQRCVRAIRRGERAYIVAIKGNRTAWLKNVRANPQVRLHLRGGTFAGQARELRDTAETETALSAYCETAGSFEYLECMMWRGGRPSRSKAVELHRHWFESGIPLVVELSR